MEETKKREIKIDMKSVLKVVILLYVVIVFVGVLTYVLPSGSYPTQKNPSTGKTEIVPGSEIEWLEGKPDTFIPWYRWLTLPIENIILSPFADNLQMYEIFALLLILGGCFKVMEECGGLEAVIKLIVSKFKSKRYTAIWIITAMMSLLASFFGLQDDLLILFPICLSFASAMGWSDVTALSLVLLASSTGFTCAILNPYTVGVCYGVVGVNIWSGAWFRAIMLVILTAFTAFYIVKMAKKDELDKNLLNNEVNYDVSLTAEERKKATMVISLFGFALAIVIIFTAVPALQKLGLDLIIMGVAFVIGTVVLGKIMIGTWQKWFSAFWKGMKSTAPSLLVIATAFSIKYMVVNAEILHTIFNFIQTGLPDNNFLKVIILLGVVLVLEFFIPSGSAKAALIMPVLTIGDMGLSTNVIILAYLLGDGYTNVVFPTCGTLMIGLGLANVSLTEWYKRTWKLQLVLLGSSILFLLLAVALGV